jgi:hypothetical protein
MTDQTYTLLVLNHKEVSIIALDVAQKVVGLISKTKLFKSFLGHLLKTWFNLNMVLNSLHKTHICQEIKILLIKVTMMSTLVSKMHILKSLISKELISTTRTWIKRYTLKY